MTSPYDGLRSGAAPEALAVGYVNPAFIPRPWLRSAHEDDESAPTTMAREPLPDTILEGDSSEQERAAYQGASRQASETDLRVIQNMPQTEGTIPAPSVPKWGRNQLDSRPHVQSQLYETIRPYDELAAGVPTNRGNVFPFTDTTTYVEQGQVPHGYLHPSTYTPQPDPYGKDFVTYPSDGPASGDSPSSWS